MLGRIEEFRRNVLEQLLIGREISTFQIAGVNDDGLRYTPLSKNPLKCQVDGRFAGQIQLYDVSGSAF